MTNSQLEQEILKYKKRLFDETLKEVIDFIKFLKYEKNKNSTEIDDILDLKDMLIPSFGKRYKVPET